MSNILLLSPFDSEYASVVAGEQIDKKNSVMQVSVFPEGSDKVKSYQEWVLSNIDGFDRLIRVDVPRPLSGFSRELTLLALDRCISVQIVDSMEVTDVELE